MPLLNSEICNVNFNDSIKTALTGLIKEHKLKLEESTAKVLLRTSKVTIALNLDPDVIQCFVHIGKDASKLVKIGSEELAEVFNYTLPIRSFPVSDFAEDVTTFLEEKKEALFTETSATLHKLYALNEVKSRKIEQERILRQAMNRAEQYWEQRNYEGFIRFVDGLDSSMLNEDTEKKYAIARKRIRQ